MPAMTFSWPRRSRVGKLLAWNGFGCCRTCETNTNAVSREPLSGCRRPVDSSHLIAPGNNSCTAVASWGAKADWPRDSLSGIGEGPNLRGVGASGCVLNRSVAPSIRTFVCEGPRLTVK